MKKRLAKDFAKLTILVGVTLLLSMTSLGAAEAGAVFNRIGVFAHSYDALTTQYTVIAKPGTHAGPAGTMPLILPRGITLVSAQNIIDATNEGEGAAQYTVEPHPNGTDDIYLFTFADEEMSGVFDWQGVEVVFRMDEPLYDEVDGRIRSSFRFVLPNALTGLEIAFEAPMGMIGSGTGVTLLTSDLHDMPMYGISYSMDQVRAADQEIIAEVFFDMEVDPGPAEAVALGVSDTVAENKTGMLVGAAIGAIILVIVIVVIVARRSRMSK